MFHRSELALFFVAGISASNPVETAKSRGLNAGNLTLVKMQVSTTPKSH